MWLLLWGIGGAGERYHPRMQRTAGKAIALRHCGATKVAGDVDQRREGQLARAGRRMATHAVRVVELAAVKPVAAVLLLRINVAPEPAVVGRRPSSDDDGPAVHRAGLAVVVVGTSA